MKRTIFTSLLAATSLALAPLTANASPLVVPDVSNAGIPHVASADELLAQHVAAGEVGDVFLGVGAHGGQTIVNWTSKTVGTEYLQFVPASAVVDGHFPAESATTIQAGGNYMTIDNYRIARHAVMDGLTPGTDYAYRIGSDETGWTAPYKMRTPGQGSNWEFIAFGDPQIGASGDPVADGATWRQTTSNALANHPNTSLFLTLGDQVDSFFDTIDQQVEYNHFFSAEELTRIPTAVLRGNHDAPSKAHREMFTMPNETGQLLDAHNYHFLNNNVLFVALDTNTMDLAGQEAYLRNVVAAQGAQADWIVVKYHHATYSQAYHQIDAVAQAYREHMTPVFSELGVDVVLSGHDHIHTRSNLMVGDRPTPDVRPSAPGSVLHPRHEEVLYITASSASGSKYYPFYFDGVEYEEFTSIADSDAAGLTSYSTAYWLQDYTPDYTHVAVTPTTLTLTTYNSLDGTMVDKITLDKSVNPGPLPEFGDPANELRNPTPNRDLVNASLGSDGLVGILASLGVDSVLHSITPTIEEYTGMTVPTIVVPVP